MQNHHAAGVTGQTKAGYGGGKEVGSEGRGRLHSRCIRTAPTRV